MGIDEKVILSSEKSIELLESADPGLNLQSNVAAKIRNPLAGVPRETLLRDVEAFAQDKGLMDSIDELRKGALLAQAPANFQELDCLSSDDKAVLDHESKHRWSHPLLLWLTIFACSIGAATQGWDQTGSNGANLSFPDEFGISDRAGTPNAEYHSWLIGVINAAPYLSSAGLGCWLSDPLNNLVGRRGVIFLTALILIITPICSGLTQTWQELFIVRLIMGIGMGLKGATVPVFAAENSPASIRGALVMSWQAWTALGIFLGFAANLIVQQTGEIAWRLQLGSAFIPAVPLAFLIFFCPESPRWLMKKGRYQAALQSLVKLRHTKLQACRDLYYAHVLLEEELKISNGANYFKRLTELFTVPRVRRATMASGIVMLAQQMCGINIIAFYSSSIFSQGGFTDRQALIVSLGFGATNFLFAIPAFFTIDTFGRRTLLLFTFPLMFIFLLATGLSFQISEAQATLRLALIALWIFLFAAAYSPGEGPVPFTYSAEVFPLTHREHGMAWAVSVCLGFAAVLSITFPRMVQVFTPMYAFIFYAMLNLVALFMIWAAVPETKQKTLEELDQVFSVPSGVFLKYQATEALPYFFKRYVFFQKTATLRPLYQQDGELATATKAQK